MSSRRSLRRFEDPDEDVLAAPGSCLTTRLIFALCCPLKSQRSLHHLLAIRAQRAERLCPARPPVTRDASPFLPASLPRESLGADYRTCNVWLYCGQNA